MSFINPQTLPVPLSVNSPPTQPQAPIHLFSLLPEFSTYKIIQYVFFLLLAFFTLCFVHLRLAQVTLYLLCFYLFADESCSTDPLAVSCSTSYFSVILKKAITNSYMPAFS